eukprot:CAMPEP_0194360824 /NCGR_PEP_ID=MMETSP0174-20130528/8257_1 /TAXON_ID=216777 /ORGANISM="Proboscia alata, Strain PI-D3" /LENGTH=54 /DNA_ID=CAMNT_0039132577 /DNA_START=182 /DNA_END=346 /DNA_ORIENTATION=+
MKNGEVKMVRMYVQVRVCASKSISRFFLLLIGALQQRAIQLKEIPVEISYCAMS